MTETPTIPPSVNNAMKFVLRLGATVGLSYLGTRLALVLPLVCALLIAAVWTMDAARTDRDRSGNPRHRAEHLHPQGRACERPAAEHGD